MYTVEHYRTLSHTLSHTMIPGGSLWHTWDDFQLRVSFLIDPDFLVEEFNDFR